MAISAIGGVTTAGSATPANLTVSQQDFLRILVTQLSFQDPMKPIDNQEFIAQLAQFTNLEQTRLLSGSIDTLLTVQATSQALGLIGRTVEVAAAAGPVTGTVTTVTFGSDGQPALSVRQANGAILTEVNPATVTLVR